MQTPSNKIQFSANAAAASLASNIQAILDAILETYVVDSSYYTTYFASISPFPNKKHDITLSASSDKKCASITIPINDAKAIFDVESFELLEQITASDSTARAEAVKIYHATLHEHFNTDTLTVEKVQSLNDLPKVSFDITNLNESTLQAIEKALQVSGLKPRAPKKKDNSTTSCESDISNEYIVIVTNDDLDEEWFKVRTNHDFYSMEYEEIVSVLQEKISISEDEKVSFTSNNMKEIFLSK